MINTPVDRIGSNRLELFEGLLIGLMQQTTALDSARVALFQDHGDPVGVGCLDVIRSALPVEAVFWAEQNHGVGFNIGSAERNAYRLTC